MGFSPGGRETGDGDPVQRDPADGRLHFGAADGRRNGRCGSSTHHMYLFSSFRSSFFLLFLVLLAPLFLPTHWVRRQHSPARPCHSVTKNRPDQHNGEHVFAQGYLLILHPANGTRYHTTVKHGFVFRNSPRPTSNNGVEKSKMISGTLQPTLKMGCWAKIMVLVFMPQESGEESLG